MSAVPGNPKHIVVLMFENRSFDHLFGDFPGANGLREADGSWKDGVYNLDCPTEKPGSGNTCHRPMALTPDVPVTATPNHDFDSGMTQELFGPGATGWVGGSVLTPPAQTYPAVNSGFVSTLTTNPAGEVVPAGPQAISYYTYPTLQVLHPLAAQFVLCDNWFCDMPGDTLLNRYFMHTAQTGGDIGDNQWGNISSPDKTIFEQIEEAGRSWRIYTPAVVIDDELTLEEKLAQIDSRFLRPTVANSPHAHHPIWDFAADAANGTLPFYSFLMCWFPTNDSAQETSMHPVSDIRAGENYLAAVYRALRVSPSWEDTLLIVTFDENGAFYDHVAPPKTIAPMPGLEAASIYEDDQFRQETMCYFDFTLLGPRIPALLVSPWLKPGICSSPYQNTSILRLLQDLMGSQGLTQRDAQAPSLGTLFDEFGLAEARDCPAGFETYAGHTYADGALSRRIRVTEKLIPIPDYLRDVARIYGLGECF